MNCRFDFYDSSSVVLYHLLTMPPMPFYLECFGLCYPHFHFHYTYICSSFPSKVIHSAGCGLGDETNFVEVQKPIVASI